jgi:hypothetical protein
LTNCQWEWSGIDIGLGDGLVMALREDGLVGKIIAGSPDMPRTGIEQDHALRPGHGHSTQPPGRTGLNGFCAALAVQAAAFRPPQECSAGRISIPMASMESRKLAALPGTAGEITYGLPTVTGDERILPDWGEAVPAAGTGGPRYWR